MIDTFRSNVRLCMDYVCNYANTIDSRQVTDVKPDRRFSFIARVKLWLIQTTCLIRDENDGGQDDFQEANGIVLRVYGVPSPVWCVNVLGIPEYETARANRQGPPNSHRANRALRFSIKYELDTTTTNTSSRLQSRPFNCIMWIYWIQKSKICLPLCNH